MTNWRAEAERVIKQGLQHCKDNNLTGKDRVKYIDSLYPFNTRQHTPYKVWLEVRRLLVPEIGQEAYRKELAKRGIVTLGEANK